MGTQQSSTNFSVRVDGDEASARSYLTGHHHIAGFEGGEDVTLRARYDDDLVRTDAGWKLTGIRLTLFSLVGNPAILA